MRRIFYVPSSDCLQVHALNRDLTKTLKNPQVGKTAVDKVVEVILNTENSVEVDQALGKNRSAGRT